ncbi:MAG: hypothetical protein ABH896_02955 [Candidatus Jacksonbacteria bacterium]
MDQKLELKLKQFNKALLTLKDALAQPKINTLEIQLLNDLNTVLNYFGKF